MERFHSRKSFTSAMKYVPHAHPELIESLWAAPGRLIEAGDKLTQKQCVRTTVRYVADEDRYVVKRHLERSWRHLVKQWVSISRAERCWRDTWFLIDNGYPTPSPVAFCEERFGSLRGNSFYVYKFVEGKTLRGLATDLKNQRLLRKYVCQLAEIWQFHKHLGVNLSDGHPDNFIIAPSGKMWVIDLDKLKYSSPGTKNHREQLEESFMDTIHGVFGDKAVVRYGRQKIRELLTRQHSKFKHAA